MMVAAKAGRPSTSTSRRRRTSTPRSFSILALAFPFDSRASAAKPGAAIAPASTDARSSRRRSEEHTSELQSLMRISYAVFCLKKKNTQQAQQNHQYVTNIQHNSKRHT